MNCEECGRKIDSADRLGEEVFHEPYMYRGGTVVSEREATSLIRVLKNGDKLEVTTFK